MTTAFVYQGLTPGMSLGSQQFHLTREAVARYSAAVEDPTGWLVRTASDEQRVHPVFFARDLLEPVMRAAQRSQPFQDYRGLHAKEDCWFVSPGRLNSTVTAEIVLADHYIKREKEYITVEGRFVDDLGALLAVTRATHMLYDYNPERARIRPTAPGTKEEFQSDLSPLTKTMTLEKQRLYSGPGSNYHTDDAVAQRLGFDRAFAQGLMAYAYLSEMLTRYFGESWLSTGKLVVNFLRRVYPGDVLTCRGRLRTRTFQGSKEPVGVDVWCVDRAGILVAAGVAYGYKEL